MKISWFSLLLIVFSGCIHLPTAPGKGDFDGLRAYQDLEYQLSLGPRISGTGGQESILEWMEAALADAGWSVEIQLAEYNGKVIRNLIAYRSLAPEYILVGAHYDTRIHADQDPNPELRNQPVPGANDGASGVAVLLELARVLPEDLPVPVRLVFFDAEDNGGIDDWDWCQGSRVFVRDYQQLPAVVVIVDMVGDADLGIYYEYNSDPALLQQIWAQAGELGYSGHFVEEYRHSVLDDHIAFIEAGIPAVDIIDFDYPYWHTTADTLDKTSPESLEMVGRVLQSWILDR